MLAQSLRVSRSVLVRTALRQPTLARTFVVPTAARQADLVQEIYLRELKSYKPVPETAAAAAEAVKKWSPPATPALPESANPGITNELSAYEAQVVEVEGQEATVEGKVPAPAKEEDWFEEEIAFKEDGATH